MTNFTHVQGGGVPGGHHVLVNPAKGTAFIPQMAVCHAIPLLHSDVVVDIGAYVGTFAITAARFPVRKVIAYEPAQRSFNVLNMTKLVNLDARQAAIVRDVPASGFTMFYLSHGIGVRNSTLFSRRKDAIHVPAVAYRDAVRDATVVKIDIEGGEYALDLVQPQLRALFVEFHHVGKDWRKHAEAIAADFTHAGFETIVTPKYDRGFSAAGAWLRRDFVPAHEYCDALMQGDLCCGCSCELVRTAQSKSLCEECAALWQAKHREGFNITRRRFQK